MTAEIAALLKTYRLASVVGDKYAARWVIEAFGKVGINYRHSLADRSAIYLDALPLFTSGRARLIDSTRLLAQLAALERRTFPTGRDRVDHGRSGRDDAANAAAGALVLAARNVAEVKYVPIPDLSRSALAAANPRGVPWHYLKQSQEPWRPFVGADGSIKARGDRWGPI